MVLSLLLVAVMLASKARSAAILAQKKGTVCSGSLLIGGQRFAPLGANLVFLRILVMV